MNQSIFLVGNIYLKKYTVKCRFYGCKICLKIIVKSGNTLNKLYKNWLLKFSKNYLPLVFNYVFLNIKYTFLKIKIVDFPINVM